MNILCWLGFHVWIVHDEPFLGRRNLSHWDATLGGMVMEYGPEEMIYRGPETGAPVYRDCSRCGKRQIQLQRGWI